MYDGIFLTGHPYLEAAAFAVICAGIVAFLIVGAPRIIYYRIRFGKASVIVADFVQRASEDNDDFMLSNKSIPSNQFKLRRGGIKQTKREIMADNFNFK